jgi:hypothetical protein
MPMHDPVTGAQQRVSPDGSICVSPHPFGATPVVASSGVVANAAAAASIAAVAGKTSYLSGFQCTALGATAVGNVTVAVTGAAGGTLSYKFQFPVGVTAIAAPLNMAFNPPIAASAPNTAITVTLPAGGAGNTDAVTNVQGYQLQTSF